MYAVGGEQGGYAVVTVPTEDRFIPLIGRTVGVCILEKAGVIKLCDLGGGLDVKQQIVCLTVAEFTEPEFGALPMYAVTAFCVGDRLVARSRCRASVVKAQESVILDYTWVSAEVALQGISSGSTASARRALCRRFCAVVFSTSIR